LVAMVVADHELSANTVARGRPERLDGVHTAAVTGEADHSLARLGELDTQRAGDAHAQRAAARLEEVIRQRRRQVARDVRRASQRLVEQDDILRHVLRQLFYEAGGTHWHGVALLAIVRKLPIERGPVGGGAGLQPRLGGLLLSGREPLLQLA